MTQEREPQTYSSTGVNYDAMDPVKRLAQQAAAETTLNLDRFGATEVVGIRGESAYVIEEQDRYVAHVIEGLGTKNLVADEVRKFTGKTHYDTIAQDAVAMIVNDLITVGADPQVISAYWAVGDSEWFLDEERSRDLVEGWKKAVDMSGAVWGGGETPTLKGIINSNSIDLGGSAVGIVNPKDRLASEEKLKVGDAIFMVESSGIHANGLTLARSIADSLPEGYQTLLSDGKTYGESLLMPTHIYAKLVRDLFEAGIDIHYMVNITGHGWRKLMRAKNPNLSYVIDQVPKSQTVFQFIKEQSRNDDREMYGNFNMGAGFAIFIPQKDVKAAEQVARDQGLNAARLGYVRHGPKQVHIQPKNIVFAEDDLAVR